MQGKTISKMANTFIQFFDDASEKIDNLIKFVKRPDTAKLSAKIFFKVLTLGCLSKTSISLEELSLLFKQEGIAITKQGLHERFNAKATDLMKALFEESLERFKNEQNALIELLKPFSSVKLLDSSSITLPTEMKDVYQGCGGTRPEAAVKIQTIFDYVKGHVEDIILTDARKNDQSFKEHLSRIEKGALYLQDLGYFDVKSFATFHAQGAYFLSRHFYQTALFDEGGDRINLATLLDKKCSFFSLKVWLGTAKVPVRIIAQRLPKAVIEKRIKKLKAKSRKKGKRLSQETLNFARWSICITNIPKDMLKDKQVYLLYSVRWQIELFFKLCKQDAGIDKIRGKKTDCILCEIYAKLICVMMLLHLCFPIRWQGEREISFSKAYQFLRKNIELFSKALCSLSAFKAFLKTFLYELQAFAVKDIKRKRPATHQKLMNATGQKVLA